MRRYIGKIISIFVFVFLVVAIYFIFFHRNQSPSYIDTINAMDVSTSNIFAVGTNNANDKELSKAKFAKYDFNRQKIFEKVYNKGYRSNFNDVLFDEDDVVLVGSYESSKKDHQNSISTAIILKYDTDGNLLFEKEYTILSDTEFFRVLSMDYGYLAIGTGKNKSGKKVAVMVKYGNNGAVEWNVTFDKEENVEFQDAIIYNNFIYIVGRADNHMGVLAKYNIDGNLVQYITNNQVDSLGFSSITQVNDSLVVTTGLQESDSSVVPMLIRYNLDLGFINEATYSMQYPARFQKVITDSNNNLVVFGTAYEKQDGKVIHHSFIGKYRSDLTEVQVVNYYNESDDYFTDVVSVDDSYLVSGYSFYSGEGYFSKFMTYSEALKLLEVK